ncbi:circumsporozoite protein-like [Saccostrea cucullata]|uniref:circumsporozoite protein-like n=1 Tax=Saccostrea cuccullata TaxID=36930 RepID=UPI002ED41DDB
MATDPTYSACILDINISSGLVLMSKFETATDLKDLNEISVVKISSHSEREQSMAMEIWSLKRTRGPFIRISSFKCTITLIGTKNPIPSKVLGEKDANENPGTDVGPIEGKDANKNPGTDVGPIEGKDANKTPGTDVGPIEEKDVNKNPGTDVGPIEGKDANKNPGTDVGPIEGKDANKNPGTDVGPIEGKDANKNPGTDVGPIEGKDANKNPGTDVGPIEEKDANKNPGTDVGPIEGKDANKNPGTDVGPIEGKDANKNPGTDVEPIEGKDANKNPGTDVGPIEEKDANKNPGTDVGPIEGKDANKNPGTDVGPIEGKDANKNPGTDVRPIEEKDAINDKNSLSDLKSLITPGTNKNKFRDGKMRGADSPRQDLSPFMTLLQLFNRVASSKIGMVLLLLLCFASSVIGKSEGNQEPKCDPPKEPISKLYFLKGNETYKSDIVNLQCGNGSIAVCLPVVPGSDLAVGCAPDKPINGKGCPEWNNENGCYVFNVRYNKCETCSDFYLLSNASEVAKCFKDKRATTTEQTTGTSAKGTRDKGTSLEHGDETTAA